MCFLCLYFSFCSYFPFVQFIVIKLDVFPSVFRMMIRLFSCLNIFYLFVYSNIENMKWLSSFVARWASILEWRRSTRKTKSDDRFASSRKSHKNQFGFSQHFVWFFQNVFISISTVCLIFSFSKCHSQYGCSFLSIYCLHTGNEQKNKPLPKKNYRQLDNFVLNTN